MTKMAPKTMPVVLAAIVMVTLVPMEAMGQSDCQNEIASLSVCSTYISENNSSTPSSQCCERFESVYHTGCLCSGLDERGPNRTRVLQLPNACSLQLPSPSFCLSPPEAPGARSPPSGHSTKTRNSLMLSVLSAAACARIFI